MLSFAIIIIILLFSITYMYVHVHCIQLARGMMRMRIPSIISTVVFRDLRSVYSYPASVPMAQDITISDINCPRTTALHLYDHCRWNVTRGVVGGRSLATPTDQTTSKVLVTALHNAPPYTCKAIVNIFTQKKVTRGHEINVSQW